MRLNQKGALDMMLTVALVAVLAVGGFVLYRVSTTSNDSASSYEAVQVSDKSDATANTDIDQTTEEDGLTEQTGYISGQASYPSEFLPADYTVCARPVLAGEDVCTSNFEDLAYIIEAAQGDYTVFAISEERNYVAYYNECSVADVAEVCPSENPDTNIIVSVSTGETIENIDPSSWYGPDDYSEFVAQ